MSYWSHFSSNKRLEWRQKLELPKIHRHCLYRDLSIPIIIIRCLKYLFFMFVNVNIIYQPLPSFEEFEEPNFATWRTLKENGIVQHGEHLTEDTDNCQARIQPSNVSPKQIWRQLQEGLTS